MPDHPLEDKTRLPISPSLEYTLTHVRDVLRVPLNYDVNIRRFSINDFSVALVFLDGMINSAMLNLHVMEPAMQAKEFIGDPAGRVDWLTSSVISSSGLTVEEAIDDTIESILKGDAVLFVDGCTNAIAIDVKGFPKRDVDKPINETVISGPHEAFVENMKTNVNLLRRSLPSPRLVAEKLEVGKGIPTDCTLIYLDGVANEQILTEIRRRLEGVVVDYVPTSGDVEQLIEDSPFSLLPQFVHTERPDRAVSFLVSGMAVLIVEGSPTVLGMPSSMMHLFHTPDLNTMRFPIGTFKQIIISLSLLLTMFLPAIYLSLLTHHNEVLPLALMTAIYETESRVPVPALFQILFLSIGFDLISEAGARMPGALGTGLGTVSAIILGQAVVAADLVSPLVILIVAISSLGILIVPEYTVSLSLRIAQFTLIVAAAIGGIFGILIVTILAGIEMCGQTSLGVPLMWTNAPERMHNSDIFSRYPLWQQRIRMYLSNPAQFTRMQGRSRAWENKEKRNGK